MCATFYLVSCWQVTVADEVAPTINAIKFRPNTAVGVQEWKAYPDRDGVNLAPVWGTTHYFGPAPIGTKDYARVGATALNDRVKGVDYSQIDFVVSAYDRFGTLAQAPNARKVSPAYFEFRVTGQGGATLGVDSGDIPSFDFSKVSNNGGAGGFADVLSTRAFYADDERHKSVMVPPSPGEPSDNPYWYIVTNTPNAALPASLDPPGPGPGTPMPNKSMDTGFWASMAGKGQPFATNQKAAKNADAAYPDGLYTVSIATEDLWGRRTVRDANVLLSNFERGVKMGKAAYRNDQALVVTGGEQYLAGQSVDIYVVAVDSLGSVPWHHVGQHESIRRD